MNTGEMLITAGKGDIYSLLKDHLGLLPNLISPFAGFFQGDTVPSIHTEELKNLAGNPDVVACIRILAEPVVTYHIRLAGPATKPGEMHICSIDHLSFVLATTFDNYSYGMQYCATTEYLAGFLSSFLLLNTDNEYEPQFPATMDLEFFILIANTIDAYKYTINRNALAHEAISTLTLTSTEFNTLLKNSLLKPDFGWLVTNIAGLLPSSVATKLQGSEKNYLDLFENGYLIAVKNNHTGEESLMLSVVAIDAGAEFANTWIKSAGIERLCINEKGIETKPLAFFCSTALTNHYFNFSVQDGMIQYEPLNNTNSKAAISNLFDTHLEIKPVEKPVSTGTPAFCMKCGAKLKQGARFCPSCGNKL
ncbi:MAG: zinc ribbon domain-containing protein [Bacteroidota bacterium]